jgi:hypothetical protein
MFDAKKLQGATVVLENGTKGHVVSVAADKTVIEWQPQHVQVVNDPVAFAAMKVVVEGKEVSVAEFATSPDPQPTLADELSAILSANTAIAPEDASEQGVLDEDKKKSGGKHWPFKNQSKNGPGPNHEFGQREVGRKDDWKCKCSGYVCHCSGTGDNKGAKKTVKIKRNYKKRYNKAYKAWRKK